MPSISRVKVINSNTHKDWNGKQVQIGVGKQETSQGLQPANPNEGFHIT